MPASSASVSPTATAFGSALPLVSVGIPTFNRPSGLRRTLQQICDQTYKNIEIIVSDNASPDPATRAVVEEFAARDHRIKSFQQSKNIGANENFRFVLRQASGEYFMWAADDDEWSPTFIERCVSVASPVCSVMTGFNVLFRSSGTVQSGSLPVLRAAASPFENLKSFLSNMQPSLIYGLHPRQEIQFFLTDDPFDFYDCYFVLRLILNGQYCTIDESFYVAGVDAEKYEIKLVGRKLAFMPFFLHSAIAISKCRRLSMRERALLLANLARLVVELRRFHRGARA